MSNDVTLRVAKMADAPELLAIYAPYVQKTAITFEYEVPTLVDFQSRIIRTLENYPYLVACADGEILGYAYTGAFHERPAYGWGVETSIYVREDQRHKGLGKKLYLAIEDVSKLQHVLNMNACIAYAEVEDSHLTNNSVAFHKHLGFEWVGKFHQCGYKFDTWYHMVWMEKMIGTHEKEPLPVIPFSQLKREDLLAIGIMI